MNLATIDPFTLPELPLEMRSQLPNITCIYFCLSKSGEVLYIGKAEKLKQRWKQHHRYKQLQAMSDVKIAYLSVDSPDLLSEVEKALIAWFEPLLNWDESVRSGGIPIKVRRYQETEIPDFGEKLKVARTADGRSVQILATLAGISTGYWYQLENEQRSWVSDEVIKAIESVLGVDFGVSFDT